MVNELRALDCSVSQTNPGFFSFSSPSFNRLSPRSNARKNWSCANVTVATADDDTTAAERGERNGSKRLEMFLQVIPLRFIAVRSNAGQRVESLHSVVDLSATQTCSQCSKKLATIPLAGRRHGSERQRETPVSSMYLPIYTCIATYWTN